MEDQSACTFYNSWTSIYGCENLIVLQAAMTWSIGKIMATFLVYLNTFNINWSHHNFGRNFNFGRQPNFV